MDVAAWLVSLVTRTGSLLVRKKVTLVTIVT
jgi:hypothetical protein